MAAQDNLDDPMVVPSRPPKAWFEEIPDWFDPDGSLVQIDFETGRVAALVAPYGECILDGGQNCWTPPESHTGYEYAHVGTILTEEGDKVRIANIGGSVPHASLHASASVAQDHYANTATRRMIGRYVDSPENGGILFVGSMWPGSTQRDALEVMTSALSGDWRYIASLKGYEMVGAQLVNNPGFRPVPRSKVASAFTITMVSPRVASAGDIQAEQVIGEWIIEQDRPSLADMADRMGRVANAVAVLLDSGDDVDPFAELDDYDALANSECLSCRGFGCQRCDWVGYFADDTEAKTAAPRRGKGGSKAKAKAEEVVEKIINRAGPGGKGGFDARGFWHDPNSGKFAPRGFVGTSTLRALNGKGKGAEKAMQDLRQKAGKNYRPGIRRDEFLASVIGPRPGPKDREAQLGWERAFREMTVWHTRESIRDRKERRRRMGVKEDGYRETVRVPAVFDRDEERRLQDVADKLASEDPDLQKFTGFKKDTPGKTRELVVNWEWDDASQMYVPGPASRSNADVREALRELRARVAQLSGTGSEEEIRKRADELNTLLGSAHESVLTNDAIHNKLGPSGKEWTADRKAIQEQIVDDIMAMLEGRDPPLPTDERRALFLGGLPGAGKSYSLDNLASDLGVVAIDLEKPKEDWPENATHVALNPDAIKLMMARRGMHPDTGLKPMENATFMHEESSVITEMLEERLLQQGFNIVHDGTMNKEDSALKKMQRLEDAGYGDKIDGFFVDISPEESMASAEKRYLDNADSDLGGRLVPKSISQKGGETTDAQWRSENRRVFESLVASGRFRNGKIIRNDGVSERDDQGNSRALNLVVGRIVDGKLERTVTGNGTPDDPFVVSDVDTAARLLARGGVSITLADPSSKENGVGTLLDKLDELVQEAKAKGEKAPTYDLCRVMVPQTNLFCAGSIGRDRVEMPQLATNNPTPGSLADGLPRNEAGWVELVNLGDSSPFVEFLRANGVNVDSQAMVRASWMRASQRELNGGKVAIELNQSVEVGKESLGAVVVTKDGYIVDGHHRWAAMASNGYQTGTDPEMPVVMIDMSITDVLDQSVVYSAAMGIPAADADGKPDLEFNATKKAVARMRGDDLRNIRAIEGIDPKVAEIIDAELQDRPPSMSGRVISPALVPGANPSVEDIQALPSIDGGDGSIENPFLVSDMDVAAALLADGDYNIRLNRPEEVGLLVDKLGGYVREAKAQGKDAPVLDLCKVTVPGTNLFCAESIGRPRAEMPQLAAPPDIVVPGSNADRQGPVEAGGWVELTDGYFQFLRDQGIEVDEAAVVEAGFLKPSQAELNGAKVSGIVDDLDAKKEVKGVVMVTTDNYIIDGHHRAGANITQQFEKGEAINMEVTRIDMDIVSVLDSAVVWSSAMGIPPQDAAGKPDMTFDAVKKSAGRMATADIEKMLEMDNMVPAVEAILRQILEERKQKEMAANVEPPTQIASLSAEMVSYFRS